MIFPVNVEIDGLVHKFETTAELADDLEAPLRVFGAYLLRGARARYKAQNFAPLAESTIAKRAGKGLRSLERKLQRDVRKAFQRARHARSSAPRGLLGNLFGTATTDLALEDALSGSTRGVQNRIGVLAEFQQHHGANWGKKGGKLADRIEAKPLSIKQSISLGQREARAVMRQVGKPILGGLDRTLRIIVEQTAVTLKSQTHQEFSEALNAGATVGKGAKLPARPTIFVEAGDLDVLRSILIDHQLLPFLDGLQGPAY